MEDDPAVTASNPLRSLARRFLPAPVRTAIVLSGRGAAAFLGRSGALLARSLPLAAQARLRHELQPVGRLDYAGARLRLAAGSPWEHYRLRSCAKEPETVAWIERNVRPGDVFLDVGANVGAYSLVAFHRGATVYAVEPVPSTYAALCGNVLLNRAQGRILPLAFGLSDVTRLHDLALSDPSAGAAWHTWGTTDGAFQRTPCFALDDLARVGWLAPPNLLKLDVDGPEVAILRGAPNTLRLPQLRAVIAELDFRKDGDEAVRLLCDAGFREERRTWRQEHGAYANVEFAR